MKINASPHRPFPPNSAKPWVYYQEWNNALFLHFKVPEAVLEPYIPQGLTLDSFESSCWVSLVAFTMNKVRPRYVPSMPFISDFHEVNLRTYIKDDKKPGVFFLSIEGEKALSNFIAKHLSGLPYEKADIARAHSFYESYNNKNSLKAQFDIGVKAKKEAVDIWLTERYALYLTEGQNVYRYEIDHEEWDLKEVLFNTLDLSYKVGTHALINPDRAHYSPGVKVIAWSREIY